MTPWCPHCSQPWHEWRGTAHAQPFTVLQPVATRTRPRFRLENGEWRNVNAAPVSPGRVTVTLADYGPTVIDLLPAVPFDIASHTVLATAAQEAAPEGAENVRVVTGPITDHLRRFVSVGWLAQVDGQEVGGVIDPQYPIRQLENSRAYATALPAFEGVRFIDTPQPVRSPMDDMRLYFALRPALYFDPAQDYLVPADHAPPQ